MSDTIFSEPQQEIQIVIHRKSAKASSRNISAIFEKTHKNVLRVVDRIMSETSNDFHKLNFEPVETIRKNSMGKEYTEREVFMTRDGFSLVMMSLTGSKAMEKKIAYINAFNSMEKALMSSRGKRASGKTRMLHTAVFNTGSMFADFDRAVGLVELRKIPESEMTAWQKVFSRAYYCTRNYSRMKDKVDKELMPSLRMVLTEVFGKPVSDNLVKLADHREKLPKGAKH